MPVYIHLTPLQVALAAGLILLVAAVSLRLRLHVERDLAIASLRTVGQLLLVGLILEWVFRVERWYVVMALAAVMTTVAGLTAAGRSSRRYPLLWLDSVVSVCASSWLVTGYALFAVIQSVEPWYRPQYAIPLLGMVLGNTLNGISVGLNAFTDSLVTRRDEVEALLSMGATRWEAARDPLRDSVKAGMIPIINSMMVVGLVSLPGMMTGQMLSGTAPIDAVKYQIVIMFLIAAATTFGTVGVLLLSYWRLFNRQHQLHSERITRREK